MPLRVHQDIVSLRPYVPGKPIEELQRELGLSRVVKLASNENPIGPSPKALAVLSEVAAALNRYPDGGAHRLRTVLAERWKVHVDQVILGNGSDEILGLLARAFLAPGDEAVMADETFVIYKMEVTAAHGVSVEIPLKEGRHDLRAMAEAVTEKTKLLFVCNPNNPTGTAVGKGDVDALMARIPEHVLVVFDEAYYEYVRLGDFPDTLRYVAQGRNVIVLRTFSKIYGLAGLRIGYGLTTAEITDYLNRVRPPFNANSMAQQAALAALHDEEHVASSRALNGTEMDKVRAGLEALHLKPLPSEANFLYFDAGGDGRRLFEALLREGIIIRHIRGPMVRVTIGLPEENQLFLTALRRVMRR
jgi:histidinol-phosphate aminotransferase